MRLTLRILRSCTLPVGLIVYASFACASAGAHIESSRLAFKGPGFEHPGREVTVEIGGVNAASDPKVVPELVKRVEISSRSARFNGASDSVGVCKARIPNDGTAAECPRSSRVGNGALTVLLGQPGAAADAYGVLSSIKAKLKLFNYKRHRGEPARILAVATSTAPFPGIAINFQIPVSQKGTVEVRVPKLAELPAVIGGSYPPSTQVVLSRFSTTISSPKRKRKHPFISLRHAGSVDLSMRAIEG